jgi:ribosomal protein S18 acetylase RimI-like enzyme
MPVAAGRVHNKFVASDGRPMTLRAARWEDLDAMVGFANGLVEEQRKDPGFGTLIDGPVTTEQEARWLANKLVAIEGGKEVSVVAKVDGLLAANSEVVRGTMASTAKHGVVAISVSKDYRGIGIGTQMVECLVDMSRKAGMKTLGLHVLSTNPKAFVLYEKLGFKKTGVVEKKIRRGGKSIDLLIMTRWL